MSRYLNTQEAAEYMAVSDRTIRTLCSTGQLEHERLNGRNLRFKPEWLDNYLESIRVRPEPNKTNMEE